MNNPYDLHSWSKQTVRRRCRRHKGASSRIRQVRIVGREETSRC